VLRRSSEGTEEVCEMQAVQCLPEEAHERVGSSLKTRKTSGYFKIEILKRNSRSYLWLKDIINLGE
jgi:hypothetical protein